MGQQVVDKLTSEAAPQINLIKEEVKTELTIDQPPNEVPMQDNRPVTSERRSLSPKNRQAPINDVGPALPTFGWESLNKFTEALPYILRNSEKYVALIVYYNHQLLKDILKCLSPDILTFILPDLQEMTSIEADIYNEINITHCSGNLLGKSYLFEAGQPLISWKDLEQSYIFFQTCYELTVLRQIKNKYFGFLRISSKNELPFVWNNDTKLVPLFYFEGQSDYLDSKSVDLTNKWQLRCMQFCCLTQGIRKVHYQGDTLKVVNFEYVKILFPENTSVALCWPEYFNENILTPEVRIALLHGVTPSSLQLGSTSKPSTFSSDTENVCLPGPVAACLSNTFSAQIESIQHLSAQRCDNCQSVKSNKTTSTKRSTKQKRTRCQELRKSKKSRAVIGKSSNLQPNTNISSTVPQCNASTSIAQPLIQHCENGNRDNTQPDEPVTTPAAHDPILEFKDISLPGGIIISICWDQITNVSSSTSAASPNFPSPAVSEAASCGSNRAQPTPSHRPQQSLSTRRPQNTVMAPDENMHMSKYSDPQKRSTLYSTLYRQIYDYFLKFLSRPRPFLTVEDMAEMFMHYCGLSKQDRKRLKSWIYMKLHEICNQCGYTSASTGYVTGHITKNVNVQTSPGTFTAPMAPRNGPSVAASMPPRVPGRHTATVVPPNGPFVNVAIAPRVPGSHTATVVPPTAPSFFSSLKVIVYPHVDGGGDYSVKTFSIGLRTVLGISMSNVTEDFLLNYADLEANCWSISLNSSQTIGIHNFSKLYGLNEVQQSQWTALEKMGVVDVFKGPYRDIFVKYADVLNALGRISVVVA